MKPRKQEEDRSGIPAFLLSLLEDPDQSLSSTFQ